VVFRVEEQAIEEATQTSVIDFKDHREAELGSLDECSIGPPTTGA